MASDARNENKYEVSKVLATSKYRQDANNHREASKCLQEKPFRYLKVDKGRSIIIMDKQKYKIW